MQKLAVFRHQTVQTVQVFQQLFLLHHNFYCRHIAHVSTFVRMALRSRSPLIAMVDAGERSFSANPQIGGAYMAKGGNITTRKGPEAPLPGSTKAETIAADSNHKDSLFGPHCKEPRHPAATGQAHDVKVSYESNEIRRNTVPWQAIIFFSRNATPNGGAGRKTEFTPG